MRTSFKTLILKNATGKNADLVRPTEEILNEKLHFCVISMAVEKNLTLTIHFPKK